MSQVATILTYKYLFQTLTNATKITRVGIFWKFVDDIADNHLYCIPWPKNESLNLQVGSDNMLNILKIFVY
jgi:hypothetical protein